MFRYPILATIICLLQSNAQEHALLVQPLSVALDKSSVKMGALCVDVVSFSNSAPLSCMTSSLLWWNRCIRCLFFHQLWFSMEKVLADCPRFSVHLVATNTQTSNSNSMTMSLSFVCLTRFKIGSWNKLLFQILQLALKAKRQLRHCSAV